jgi:hypothetical protein
MSFSEMRSMDAMVRAAAALLLDAALPPPDAP